MRGAKQEKARWRSAQVEIGWESKKNKSESLTEN